MNAALVVVLLMCAVTGLSLLAKRVHLPFPVAFVVGGTLLAFIPHLPRIALDPQWVFLLFLPPLLYNGGWSTDWTAFKHNRRAIGMLAIGLVVVSTVVVALVAHALVHGLSWPLAFTLGAIVAPPDAVAAEAVLDRLAVPRRIAAILSGESLVNDASALVIYRFAVLAVVTGAFSAWQAGGAFVLVSVGGVVMGIAVGVAVELLQRFLTRRQLADSMISNVLLLIAPFAAYLPAEALEVSGVLAAVAAGLYLGRRSAYIFDAETRLIASSVWEVLIFVLNGFVFVLIGLQLPAIVAGLSGSPARFALDAVAVSVAVIVIRIVWVYPATYLPRLLVRRLRESDPPPSWRSTAIVSWAGMRGIVSLAAALAVPYVDRSGIPIHSRNEIVFIAFCVIFATLVFQGSTLGPLIEWLGVAESSSRASDETEVRIRALQAGIRRLHALERGFTSATEWEVQGRILKEYEQRIDHLRGHLAGGSGDEPPSNAIDHRLQREALESERRSIMGMRRAGEIPDDVFRNIQYDLDLANVRLT